MQHHTGEQPLSASGTLMLVPHSKRHASSRHNVGDSLTPPPAHVCGARRKLVAPLLCVNDNDHAGRSRLHGAFKRQTAAALKLLFDIHAR